MVSRLSLLTFFVLTACGEDKLIGAPRQNPPVGTTCADGASPVNGACPSPPGAIAGRLCDTATGTWLSGTIAYLELPNSNGQLVKDVTDADGAFLLANVPPGSYYVFFEGPNNYENVMPAGVSSGSTTTIGMTSCEPPPGHIKGRVCDDMAGVWIEGATVTLNDAATSSTTTDQFGNFMFYSVAPGDYVVTIGATGYAESRSAQVASGQVTDLGPTSCVGQSGGFTGRICGSEGVWLAGASITVQGADGSLYETTTDGQGYYTLSGVPPGTYNVTVEKGSYSFTFPVTIEAGGVTNVPATVCIPPTQQMAVVTGIYDKVETILTDLGYVVRNRYDSMTPTIVDTAGTVDVIKGDTSTFWFDDFLTDATWLAQYDIVFFNCGVKDGALMTSTSSSTALSNLTSFVENGGSVYASDWASEIIRIAFPNRINFFNNDAMFGDARVGKSNANQVAQVLDTSLQQALSATSITINLNLPSWVVVDKLSAQPAGLTTLIAGTVSHYTDDWGFTSGSLANSPLVVRFEYGAGRVLYTSAHNESQISQDLENVLNYIVFEL